MFLGDMTGQAQEDPGVETWQEEGKYFENSGDVHSRRQGDSLKGSPLPVGEQLEQQHEG